MPDEKACIDGNPAVAEVGTTPVVVLDPAKVPAPGFPGCAKTVNGTPATVVIDVNFDNKKSCDWAPTSPSIDAIAITYPLTRLVR